MARCRRVRASCTCRRSDTLKPRGALKEDLGHAGYFWLHNAETADVIRINPRGGIRPGSQFQSQPQATESSQWWTTVEVADKAGYFWLKSAAGHLAACRLAENPDCFERSCLICLHNRVITAVPTLAAGQIITH
jgi:hypothetical protein